MMRFPEQMDGEKVLMVIRKHGIVYVKIVLGVFLIFILPAWAFVYIWYRQEFLATNTFYTHIMLAVVCLYLLFGFLIEIIAWLNDAFDLFILTDHRLIDITQVTLLKRNTASTPLEQIQDATGVVNGLIPTLLNHGKIEVQTAAGNASHFDIDYIHDPIEVGNRIVEYARNKRMGNELKAD